MTEEELQPWGSEPDVIEFPREYLGFAGHEGAAVLSPCCLEDGDDFGDEVWGCANSE